MVVAARANRLGEDDASGIDSLEDVKEVASACDLFNKDGRQTFVAQLLVHAEEINLGAAENFGSYAKGYGNARDECYKLFGAHRSYPYVPFGTPAGGFECPKRKSV